MTAGETDSSAGYVAGTVLDVTDGVVAFGGRPVLARVGVRVAAGEVRAVLGPNGSGKSTLVRAALGLVPLGGGTATLFGTPVGRFTDWRRVGYVPQRLGAGSGVPATVGEVVRAGRLARRGLLRPARAADRAAVAAALDVVGLADRTGDPVATLSGGQQQRVLIARALAGEPDLLVLDEPTAGVDAANQQALAGSLRTLVQRGVTIVLVAHELGPIAPLVDKVLVLRDGRVTYDGAPNGELDRFGWQDQGGEHAHPEPAPAADRDAGLRPVDLGGGR
jgi:zinc transport system ATP-binding protein